MNLFYLFIATLQIIVIAIFLSYVLRPFLPNKYNAVAEVIGIRIFSLLLSLPIIVRNLWIVSSVLAYYIGMFSVVVLLFAGLFLFIYTLVLQLGGAYPPLESIYEQVAKLSQSKPAWAGATIVVATTVAIGHMWNLRINTISNERAAEKARKDQMSAIRKIKNQE